jgi:hypothetical protein
MSLSDPVRTAEETIVAAMMMIVVVLNNDDTMTDSLSIILTPLHKSFALETGEANGADVYSCV